MVAKNSYPEPSPEDVRRALGNIVKGRRVDLGWSQGELAVKTKLHRTYISEVEGGARNLSLENLAKLAQGLGVGIGQLFPNGAGQTLEKAAFAPRVDKSDPFEILIVEDNPLDIELTLEAFRGARLTNTVHAVHDGAAALEYIFCRGNYRNRPMERQIGAVLLDLNLPKVSGLEVLKNIMADPLTRHIKVLVLTASRSAEEAREAMRLGAAGFITKPVDFHNFSEITAGLGFRWTLLKSTGDVPGQGVEQTESIRPAARPAALSDAVVPRPAGLGRGTPGP
jgi:CheY-like chemotaxis protein